MDKSTALQIVYDTVLKEDSLFVKIRMSQGLDHAAYAHLIQAMEFLIEEYKDAEVVPKKLALCFVDISNSFYSTDLYEGSESDQIEDAIHKISELANKLFDS